jgi:ABC-type antimicrobial peptide transport system permease subunit
MGKRLLMRTFAVMTPRSGVIMTALLPQALLGEQILGLSVYLHWLQRAMRSTVVIKRRAFAFVREVGIPGTRKLLT